MTASGVSGVIQIGSGKPINAPWVDGPGYSGHVEVARLSGHVKQ